MKVKILPLAAGMLFVLFGSLILFGQTPPQTPATPADAAPASVTPPALPTQEAQGLRAQVHQLTLQNEQLQIQNLTIQMQQLNAAYNGLVNKMVAENPGMTWDPRSQQLVPKTAPPTSPHPAPPAPAKASPPPPAKPPAK